MEYDIEQQEKRVSKKPINKFKISLIAFLIIFLTAIIFQISRVILKENSMEYRTLVEVTGTVITVLVVPTLFSVMCIMAFSRNRHMKQQSATSLFYMIGNALVLTVISLYVLVMSFILIMCGDSLFEKERMVEDSLLEGTRHEFLGASNETNYNYYKPVGWFFKKHDTKSEYRMEKIRSDYDKKLQAEREQLEKSTEEPAQLIEKESEVAEKMKENETIEVADNTTPEGAYKTLFDTVFQKNGDAYECTYNAKGNFYAILGTGQETVEGQVMNTRRTVVYDRESKNGKCQLFVAYKEYSYEDGTAGNTEILNFYAVTMKTGKVNTADKTSWSEVGSAEYCEATGE